MKISNESIIAALLSEGNVQAAAAAVGISERTMYLRMRQDDFKTEYTAAQKTILKTAADEVRMHLSAAIKTLADEMQNKEASPQTRINAANAIISSALKLSEITEIIPRIEALEKEVKQYELRIDAEKA